MSAAGKWDDRYKSRGGFKTVGDCRWTLSEYDAARVALQAQVLPLLPAVESCLDFGCGIGRWYPMLASRATNYTGVDVSLEGINRFDCPGHLCIGEFELGVSDDLFLSARGPFDLIWSCVVLQHIPDAELGDTLEKLRRHVERGATFVAVENVSGNANGPMITFRSVAEYSERFRLAGWNLWRVELTSAFGSERHAVMAFAAE